MGESALQPRETKTIHDAGEKHMLEEHEQGQQHLARQPGQEVESHDEDKGQAQDLPTTQRCGTARNSRPTYNVDWSRKHVSKGRVVDEMSTSLGSDMLGKPAYAVILRERRNRKNEQADGLGDIARETVPSQDKPIPQIEDILSNQQLGTSLGEVYDNIDELQLVSNGYISRAEFNKIFDELCEGFTSPQLRGYLEAFETRSVAITETGTDEVRVNPLKRSAEQPVLSLACIAKVEAWAPLDVNGDMSGRARKVQQRPRHVHGYGGSRQKAGTALRIMRECWGLQEADVMSGLGHVVVEVSKNASPDLLNHSERLLRQLNNLHFFDPRERVESAGTQGEGRLRIVTSHMRVGFVLRELDKALQSLRAKEVPFALITASPDLISLEMLEEVERLTNTYIWKDQSKGQLIVGWFGSASDESAAYDIEDLGHVVARFLRRASNTERGTTAIYAPAHVAGQPEGRFVPNDTSSEKWLWSDRNRSLARYVLPRLAPDLAKELLSLNNEAKAQGDLAWPLQLLSLPKIELKTGLEIEPQSGAAPLELLNNAGFRAGQALNPATSSQRPEWSQHVISSTEATFGHILRPWATAPLRSTVLNTSVPHIFSPVVPHPMNLRFLDSNPDDESHDFHVSSTILIRLVPQLGEHLAWALPTLELRLSISTSSDNPRLTGVESLHAIKHTHAADVMQPAHGVDIRVLQRQFIPLSGSPAALGAWGPIQQLLARARLDLAAGKLEMPPHQHFPIPDHLVSNPSSHTNSNDDHHLYVFDGLEVHRSINVPFYSDQLTVKSPSRPSSADLDHSAGAPGRFRHMLRYTSIEAGQSGGRRAELSLQHAPFTAAEGPLSGPPESTAQDDGSEGEARGDHSTEGLRTDTVDDDFLKAAYSLARSTALWSGAPSTARQASP